MTDTALPITLTLSSGAERMFPTLTPAQIKRIAAHGKCAFDPAWRGAHRGGSAGRAVLRRHGGSGRGCPAIRHERDARRCPWTRSVHRRGQHAFGPPRARPIARQRVGRSDRAGSRTACWRSCRPTANSSELIMRAFILRRVELIAHGLGDVVLVGSNHCSGTLRVKEFLTRNGHPYSYIDLDRDADVQELLDRFHLTAGGCARGDLPRRGGAAQPDQSADRRNASASTRPSTRPIYAMWSSSARDPRDSRRPCTPHRKGSMFWCWRQTRQGDRPVPARRSRTISAFPPASRVKRWRDGPTPRRRSSARR